MNINLIPFSLMIIKFNCNIDKIYKVFIFSLLSILLFWGNAKSDDTSNIFSTSYKKDIVFNDYDVQLNKLFIESNDFSPFLRYLVVPAFIPEYMFTLYKCDSLVVIKHKIINKNLWGLLHTKEKPIIYSTESVIYSDLYKSISSFFEHSFQYVKKNKQTPGKDGANYHFYIWNDKTENVDSVVTWSPLNNSLLHEIIQVSDEISLFAQKGKGNQKKLIRHIEDIINKIKESP